MFIETFITALALSIDALVCSVISGKKQMSAQVRLYTGIVIAGAFGFFQFLMPVLGFFAGNTLQEHFASIDHWIAFVLLAGVSVNMLKEVWQDYHGHGHETKDHHQEPRNATNSTHAASSQSSNAACPLNTMATSSTASANTTMSFSTASSTMSLNTANATTRLSTASAEMSAFNQALHNVNQDLHAESSCQSCANIVKNAPDGKTLRKINIGFLTLLAMAVGTSIDALAIGVSYGLLYNSIMLAAILIGVVCFICSFTGFYLGQALSHLHKLDPILNVVGALVLFGIGIKILIEHGPLAFLVGA